MSDSMRTWFAALESGLTPQGRQVVERSGRLIKRRGNGHEAEFAGICAIFAAES